MGSGASYEDGEFESHTSRMVLEQYDVNDDPDFDIQKYCDENETMDPVDIINIRQAFINMRDPDNDPAEMLRVRKLRLFPFLSPEDIATVINKHPSRTFIELEDKDEARQSIHPEIELASNLSQESDQIVVINKSHASGCVGCYPTNRANQSSRGIRLHRDLPGDNNLVSFEDFFNLMKARADFRNSDGIKFEQEEKNVSCFFLTW